MGSVSIANKVELGTRMPEQFADNVSQNSVAGNLPSGLHGGQGDNPVCGGPPQSSPATAATTSQLSAVNDSFNVNIKKLEKVTEAEKMQKSYKLGSVSTTYINPATAVANPVKPVTFGQSISKFNKNPLLSFMRGEYAQNVPLYNDAIAVENGFLGYNLNVII